MACAPAKNAALKRARRGEVAADAPQQTELALDDGLDQLARGEHGMIGLGPGKTRQRRNAVAGRDPRSAAQRTDAAFQDYFAKIWADLEKPASVA
jgi:hypothetical protein